MFLTITLKIYSTKNKYILEIFKLLLRVIKIVKIFLKFLR